MRLRLALLLICSGALIGCGGVPQRPDLDVCVLNVPASICICQVKHANGVTDTQRHEPLAFCDKATAFTPKEWEKVQNYLDALVQYAKNHCQ